MAAAFDQTDTTTILVYALVRPISRIDYCNGVLAGAYDVHLRQLQAVLNAAARLIVRKRKYDSISSTIRDILHWLPIRQRVEFSSRRVFSCTYNCLVASPLQDQLYVELAAGITPR